MSSAQPTSELFSIPPPGVTLDAVLSTNELGQRQSRPVDREAEIRALLLLAQHLADSPDTILQKLSEVALELVAAGSSGVSLISSESGDFYWPAIAGAWSPYIGGGTPRNFGPCGVVLDQNAPQLFRSPERYYRYLAPASPIIEEVLLIPFYVRGAAVGTVWAVSHDPARRFDAEDQRALSSVAKFAAAAFQTQQALSSMRQTEGALRDAKQRLESTLSSNEVATWLWDVEADRVFADANLRRLFGVPDEAAASGSLELYLQVIHPDDRRRVSDTITRALSSGERYELDYRIRRPDGSTLWFAARGQAQCDAQGKAARLAGVLVDITERKRAEALLIRRSQQLQRLADVLPRIYGAQNVSAVLKVGAAEVRHLLGADRARATLNASSNAGQSLEEVSTAIAAEDVALNGIPVTGVEHIPDLLATALVGRDGAPLGSLEVISTPGAVFSADDRSFLIQVAHLLAVAMDNLRLLQGLEDADRKKNEFLATLSHELRNPLAPLYSGVQLLKAEAATAPDIARISSMMERQLAQMVRLIDDLMDVSRVSRGRVELRKEWLELAPIIHQAVETSRPQIEARAHRLTIALAAEALAVHGDRARLAQVISNLLHNAAKYTEPGGHITLSVERSDGHAKVAVQDTGVGLAPHVLPCVFDLFSQVQTSLDKAQGGLGIGLSLAKSLVELHGGTISAASEGLGCGSRFVVCLPLAAAPRPSVALRSQALAPVTPRRVLIADDNTDAAETLAELLIAHGHEVHLVHDGLAAVEAAVRLRPDVVLLDLGMPKLDGYEAGQQIRELFTRRPPLLAALTGWGLEEARARTKIIGFDAHLVKPVDYAALHELLAR